MHVISPHTTATTDSAWDPGVEARLKTAADATYFRKVFVVYDSSMDDARKSSYRFAHHMVSVDGEVGAANLAECGSIIATLNGARGGAKIPEADRAGVYAHAARHLKDAGKEAPELKSEGDYLMALAESRVMDVQERRIHIAKIEVREGYRQDPVIIGHPAVFNQTADLGYFKERVAPGAFTQSIKEDDVRALWNHDPNFVLGRTKPGRDNNTLTLSEDEVGLRSEIKPPDTQMCRDLITSMKRGDVDQMSFGFTVKAHQIDRDEEGNITRTILRAKLYDISPVTFPAYTGTDVAVRSVAEAIEMEYRKIQAEKEAAAFVPDDLWKRDLELRAMELDLLRLAC